MRKVLDAWPVLRWLQAIEPTAGLVRRLLERAEARQVQLFMNMVNAGEVFYIVAKRHGRAEADAFLERALPGMPVEILIPDRELIVEAARWKAGANISYADGFALATAARLRARLVTGDPEMQNVESQILEWIGM